MNVLCDMELISAAPMPTYHFDSYEGGKPKWTPGVDNQRQYDDYKDNRREHRRPRRERETYEDAPPPPPPPAGAPPRGSSSTFQTTPM
jgi:hypothetical protein